MAYLVAVVIVLGVACLANLALTFAVIRRVRQLGEWPLAAPAGRRPPRTPNALRPPSNPRLPVGGKVKDFTASTVAGESRELSQLLGDRSVVAFFSARCAPCRDQLPHFVSHAAKTALGKDRILAVVGGQEGDARDFVRDLQDVASVVVEPMRGPVATAFSVAGWPTFYVLGKAGEIEASGAQVLDIAALPV